MQTRLTGSIVFLLSRWTLNSSVNLYLLYGLSYCLNSPCACFPRLFRSTRNRMRFALAYLISRYEKVHAVYVLPLPVAIWISDRGWLSASDLSRLRTASIWTGQSLPVFSSGMFWRLPRSWLSRPTSRRSSSGRWKVNTSRLRGSGSSPLVN